MSAAIVTVLVDGADLSSATRSIQVLDDGLDTPVKRGSNIVIPYADGELRVDKWIDARDFTVGVLIKAASSAAVNDELDALYALLPDLTAGDTSCTLTLRRTNTAGTTDTTASAEYTGGLSPQLVAPAAVKLTIRFRLLTGAFA